MRFENKIVLVTGASRGIGRACALEFAKEGAKVIVNYNTSKEKAEEVAEKIRALGSDAIAIKADISKKEDVKTMFMEATEKYDRIDILVNNAGIFDYTDSLKFDNDYWSKILSTNVAGMIYCIQEAINNMKESSSPSIVNISSISGTTSWGLSLEYEITKSSVNSITKHFAIKLGPHIRVNAVAPGGTDTDMAEKHSMERREGYIKKAPLKRRANPEDIAKSILYLASDDSKNITGQILVSDGGISLV